MYRYENSRQQGSDCVYVKYTYKDDGLEVFHSEISNEGSVEIRGTLSFDNDANGEAKLTFEGHNAKNGNGMMFP